MEFPRFDREDTKALKRFITGEEWPFHVVSNPDEAFVTRQLVKGGYDDSFWITDAGQRLGIVRLMDLDDGTPLFDLRIAAAARGRGAGTATVNWLTEHIFRNYATNRIEGNTRQDNLAMRRVFAKAGYVKEAHYRESWPGRDRMYDCVGYAILRHDWRDRTTTPVNWADA
jgi:RimJ/RimL family protein N-acetyltransferase